MSTTSQTPPPESSPPPRRWYNYWPKWRKIMIGGALILLAGSVVGVIKPDAAVGRWATNISLALGYPLLLWGFFLAMRARREARSPAMSPVEREKKLEDA